MLSEKFLSENTMISRVRYIAHANVLGCVPAHARVIARVSGNNSMWIFGKRKNRRKKKHSFHNKHIYIVRVTDRLKFYEVLFCTYRTFLFSL